MFPSRVTRFIIEAVSNLDDWYNEFFETEAYKDLDKVFTGFLDECFAAKENCPLNLLEGNSFATASELKAYVDNFLQRLEEEPIPVYVNSSNYGSVTRWSVVANGIFPALYKPIWWPPLAEKLAALFSGNATPAFEAWKSEWFSILQTDDTYLFVIQNDNWKGGKAAPVHGIKPLQEFFLAQPESSTLLSKYLASDLFTKPSWSIPTTHTFHPQYYPEFPRFKTANPILVLSTTYDPVCPLVSAKKARNSFEGSGFLEQRSFGHGCISMPSLCTAKHVRAYFNDGVLPPEGTM